MKELPIYMTFDEWARAQGFTEADLNGPLHELEGCWNAATRAENKRYAEALLFFVKNKLMQL